MAGASEGLGAAFADALAARGLNVVVVARRAEPLHALAAELRARHGVQTRAVALDLSEPQGVAQLLSELSDLSVGLLVWNAALSLIGPFLDQPLDGHLRELEVNCSLATDPRACPRPVDGRTRAGRHHPDVVA